jgi:hypothetical protein
MGKRVNIESPIILIGAKGNIVEHSLGTIAIVGRFRHSTSIDNNAEV